MPEWQISACIAYDSMFLRDLLMAIPFKLLTYTLQDVSWRCPCDFFTAWWYAIWQPSLQNLPKIAIMRYLWWIRPIYDPFIHLKHFEKNCRTSYRDRPRTSFVYVLRVNVTERVWTFPGGGRGGLAFPNNHHPPCQIDLLAIVPYYLHLFLLSPAGDEAIQLGSLRKIMQVPRSRIILVR